MGAFGPGTYEVGTAPGDIPAGKYKSPGPAGGSPICYWARLKDTSGTLESIIANDDAEGPTVFTVSPTDGAVEISDCTFTKQ